MRAEVRGAVRMTRGGSPAAGEVGPEWLQKRARLAVTFWAGQSGEWTVQGGHSGGGLSVSRWRDQMVGVGAPATCMEVCIQCQGNLSCRGEGRVGWPAAKPYFSHLHLSPGWSQASKLSKATGLQRPSSGDHRFLPHERAASHHHRCVSVSTSTFPSPAGSPAERLRVLTWLPKRLPPMFPPLQQQERAPCPGRDSLHCNSNVGVMESRPSCLHLDYSPCRGVQHTALQGQ